MKIIVQIKEIDKILRKSSDIFVMGHKYIDLDALGSIVGFCEYAKEFRLKPKIILNDTRLESGVSKAIDEMGNKYIIVKSSKIKNKIKEDSLLVIMDTNKKELLQDSSLFDEFKNVLVIDHHDKTKKTIKNGLVVIDEDSSSTCEMVGELLEYKKINISSIAANLLLAGIVLDTNNFVLNTTGNTFRVCHYLTLNNAEPIFVQNLLKQNIKKYFKRQAILTNVKVYGKIAITFSKSGQTYRREDLARVADTLIQFNKIEAAFVIGSLNKKEIGISARSLGEIKVGKILEGFGGGGTEHNAGASILNSNIRTVKLELLKIIKEIK